MSQINMPLLWTS